MDLPSMTQETESLPDPEDFQQQQEETQSMPASRPGTPPPPPPHSTVRGHNLEREVGDLVREHNDVRNKIDALSRVMRGRSSAARIELEAATRKWWRMHIEQTVIESYFATHKLDAKHRFTLLVYPSGGLISKRDIFEMFRESQVCFASYAADGTVVVSMTVAPPSE